MGVCKFAYYDATMKQFFLFFIASFISIAAYSQAYRGITIGPPPEHVQIQSYQGIEVQSLTYDRSSGFTVKFMNTNYNRSDEKNSYCFDWYLSYKGKRVSDYYSSTIYCRREQVRTNVFCWPGEVPSGNERYVTIQFGKEKPKRDRRDDD